MAIGLGAWLACNARSGSSAADGHWHKCGLRSGHDFPHECREPDCGYAW